MLIRFLPLLACAFALPACSGGDDGPVPVALIGEREAALAPERFRDTDPARIILSATAEGLVTFDARGDILPALAERWIVEDDGRSYIFRIRRATWPDGTRITAEQAATALRTRIRDARKEGMSADLRSVEQVRAMTGEVIEITLATPQPNFLQLLAQPQLSIGRRSGGAGPYRRLRGPAALILTPIPDPDAVEDEVEDAAARRNATRIVRADRAAVAITRFQRGDVALLLGGRFTDLPLLTAAGITQRQVQMDPVSGLFGLAIVSEDGFLADAGNRMALSMAIDRERLPARLGIGRWAVTAAMVPGGLDDMAAQAQPDWTAQPIETRRTNARSRVRIWTADNGPMEPLRIAMPDGPNARLLFALIAADLRGIGVPARQVALAADADLRLVDEVAAYDSALWYLGRLSCGHGMSCDPAASARVEAATYAPTPTERSALAMEAAAQTLAHGGFIPLATPVRWSLVDDRLRGFQPNPRAQHPLNQLLRPPT